MKSILVSLLFPFLLSDTSAWLTDFNQAKNLSQEKHEYILLNFSGSDWCSGCIKLHKNIFDSHAFQQYATEHLVLLNADFPRSKKNSLPAEQQKKNDALADKYNPKGIFPYTVLLNTDGTVLKKWEGYYEGGAENFVQEIKSMDANSRN
jgi:thioredoxin-related protein